MYLGQCVGNPARLHHTQQFSLFILHIIKDPPTCYLTLSTASSPQNEIQSVMLLVMESIFMNR